MNLRELFEPLLEAYGGDEGILELLAKGASASFLVKVGGAALGFVFHVALARWIGSEGYGVYAYAWSWVGVLGMLCTFGFRRSLVRFVSEFTECESWSELKGILRFSTAVVGLGSVIVGGIGIGVVWTVAQYGDVGSATTETLVVAFALLPFLSLTHVRASSIRGLKHVALADIPYRILRPAVVIALVGLGYVAEFDVGPRGAMVVTGIALAASFAVGTGWLYARLPSSVGEHEAEYDDRWKWLRVALACLVISAAGFIQSRTDVIMLGMLAGTESAGIYSATAKLTAMLGFGLIAANAIVGPVVSELYHGDRREELQHVVTAQVVGVAAFTGLGTIVLVGFGSFILSIFGPEFVRGETALMLLVVGKLANTLLGPVGLLLTMTGNERIISKVLSIAAVLNIGLNAALIPSFGLVGAACATMTSTILWNGVLVYFVRKEIDIEPTVFNVFAKIWESIGGAE